MKEGEECSPFSFVTPSKRRKRLGKTDFSNRKARQRRDERKKQSLESWLTGTPHKKQQVVDNTDREGKKRFCSIRTLILDPIAECCEDSERSSPGRSGGQNFISMSGGRHTPMGLNNEDDVEPSWLQPLPDDDQPEISEGDCDMSTDEMVCCKFLYDIIRSIHVQFCSFTTPGSNSQINIDMSYRYVHVTLLPDESKYFVSRTCQSGVRQELFPQL